jgi:molybdopterin converting factor small subunit
MSVTVRIPPPLRTLTGDAAEVTAEGATVRQVIDHLDAAHPGMAERLLEDGGLRRFVNVFVGEEDVRFLDGLDTPLVDGQVISILPAIAGG